MNILIILGVALFIIIVSAVMLLIFGVGDIGSTALMIMSLIIISAIGLAMFMGIAAVIPNTGILVPGESSIERVGLFSISPFIEIINTTICSNFDYTPGPCSGPGIQDNNNVVVYWQVLNSIGCCATYQCFYPAFEEACLKPFRLYDIYLDDIQVDWSTYDWSDYEYICTYAMPWNWQTFYNVTPGTHTIKIEQKNCVDIISTDTITFNLYDLNNSRYYIEIVGGV